MSSKQDFPPRDILPSEGHIQLPAEIQPGPGRPKEWPVSDHLLRQVLLPERMRKETRTGLSNSCIAGREDPQV